MGTTYSTGPAYYSTNGGPPIYPATAAPTIYPANGAAPIYSQPGYVQPIYIAQPRYGYAGYMGQRQMLPAHPHQFNWLYQELNTKMVVVAGLWSDYYAFWGFGADVNSYLYVLTALKTCIIIARIATNLSESEI